MSEVLIREMLANDYDLVAELANITTRKTFKQYYPQPAIDVLASFNFQKIADRAQKGTYFVAICDEEVVGVIGLIDNRLKTFFVKVEHQGEGIGRQLYDSLESLARKLSFETLEVKASYHSIPVYEHFGFKIVKQYQKERNGGTYTSTLMEKEL